MLYPFHHRPHIHGDVLRRRGGVEPCEGKQLLGDAGEPISLVPDVVEELPCRLAVHVVGLEQGVGEQADGGQWGFELMGGIGDEAPAHLLGGLEAAGELVELVGQAAELVAAPDAHPVAVLTLPYRVDAPQELGDTPGEGLGEHHPHHQRHHTDDDGDKAQVGLDPLEQRALLGVVLVEVDRPLGHGAVGNGHRRPASEGPVAVLGAEHVVAPQGGDQLPEQGVPPGGVGPPHAVLEIAEHQAVGVGDHHPGHPQAAPQQLHRPGGALGREGLRPGGQGGGQHRGLVEHGGLLGLVGQLFRHHQGVGVEQNQHRRHNHDIGQGELGLEGAPEGHAPDRAAPLIHASDSSPRPTW